MTVQQLQTQFDNAKDRLQTSYAHTSTPPTPAQLTALEPLMADVKSAKLALDRARSDAGFTDALERVVGGHAVTTMNAISRNGTGGSFAAQIRQSDFGQFLTTHKGQLRPSGSAWHSPDLPLIGFGGGDFRATTITEDPASAGGLVIPEYIPGILPLPTRPLVVADLLGSGTTTSNSVTYMAETSHTNAAAPVAEGMPKAESAMTFAAVSTPVRKIATWIPVSEEALEDIDNMTATIMSQLRRFVLLAEDDQLLNGNGTAPNFDGLVHRASAPAIVRVDPENNADAILRQIAAIETATAMTVDGIVMHPANWGILEGSKTSTGEYLANGPFAAPVQRTLWGRRVALTSAMTLGTALVGALSTATSFRRRTPVQVIASNSHSDFFIRNLICLVGEERGALVVLRTAALGLVSGLTAPAP